MDQEGVINRFVKKVVKQFSPQAILLFGSRARGDHLLHSDYDFIIISDKFAGVRWLHRIYAIVKLWEADENIDVLPYTPEEFAAKTVKSSIVRSAMKEAKLVYGELQAVETEKAA